MRAVIVLSQESAPAVNASELTAAGLTPGLHRRTAGCFKKEQIGVS